MPPLLRYLASLCLFAAVYYLAFRGGMAFTAPFSAPLWFPDSIMLCALLLTPARKWWLFLLAALSVRLYVGRAVLGWMLWPNSLNDSLKPILAALFLRQYVPNLAYPY